MPPRKLARRAPFRDPLPRVLLVCEDKKGGADYFRQLRSSEKIPIDLRVEPGAGVPKTLVERAKQLKNEAQREARRQSDAFLRYDAVWCVFDVDEHPHIPDAKQQAQANAIRTAISNPCFELWLLIHFQDQTAFIDRKVARRELKKYIPDYDKSVDYESIKHLTGVAMDRAEKLDKIHENNQTNGGNPSSGVRLLVFELQGYRRK